MKGQAITYSDAELFWIHDNRKRPRAEAHAEFVELWDRPDVSLSNYQSLCKRRGWTTGRTGQFNKGKTPANKGKRMPAHANSQATQFKKGQRPHTWRGPGHESIDNKDGYVWLIVAEPNPYTGAATRRVQKHRWMWERANGPLPAGHVLKCLDGDKTNCDPSNWACIPQAVLPRLNGRFGRNFDTAPLALRPLLLRTALLEHAAREAKKARSA